MNRTKIEWTDATVNFWWGCMKVSPGCDNCYAERDSRRWSRNIWGRGVPRQKIKSAVAAIQKLQRQADKFEAEHRRPRRVFIQSMSDIFDNEVDPAWRLEAFAEIEAADRLKIQLLTKRIANVDRMIPDHWSISGWPRHVGLMITVVKQSEAERDIPRLLELKVRYGIPWIGLSLEPLLGPTDLSEWLQMVHGQWNAGAISCKPAIDWIILGGESGPNARPMHPAWARAVRDQCIAANIPFHFKQHGEWFPIDAAPDEPACCHCGCTENTPCPGGCHWIESPDMLDRCSNCRNKPNRLSRFPDGTPMLRLGKHASGRLLDGREWNQFPDVR